MADILKSYNDVIRRNVDMLDSTHAEVVAAISQNITTKFRDAFESYDPIGGKNWKETKASGDLVFVDGNAAAASYLVVSKDPLSAGTETAIEGQINFALPVEISFGASMSQRTLGQEFSVEVVDTLPVLADVPLLEIASISQTTTTLTVDTVLPHGLSAGKSIGITGCSNAVANYPALVVASVSSPTQFTATAGPGGTIASQTITNPAGVKGFVFFRERLGRSQNGLSQIFENATVTNSSLYIRSESGDALPSGTVEGSHSVVSGTTLSVALATSPYQYAFRPTSEYRLFVLAERVQWADGVVDATSQTTSRLVRTQVCPDPSFNYKFRIRATNNKSLTVPVAQIVTAVKTGTTTATITTDRPHGLVASDPVVIYGIRDQAAASFPNLATATAVASVVDEVTFTIIIGTASTVTSYGGYVAKVQGGNLMSSLGAATMAAQSATLSTLADGTRQLVLVGSANWATPANTIGDMVELVGCRDNATGASLGIDGPWKIANAATTNLTLVLPYHDQRTIPADFASTDCGGGVIRRTCFRLSFVRIFDYARERVEMLARPAGDMGAAAPVVVQGGSIAVTTAGGQAAHDAVVTGNPLRIGARALTAPYTAVATGDQADLISTPQGIIITRPWHIPELEWSYAAAAAGILNTTTAVTIRAAAGAGLRSYLTGIQIMAETLTNATELAIRDGAGGTVLWRTKIPTGGLGTTTINFDNPLRSTANTLLEVVTLTASGAGAVFFNAQGYTAP